MAREEAVVLASHHIGLRPGFAAYDWQLRSWVGPPASVNRWIHVNLVLAVFKGDLLKVWWFLKVFTYTIIIVSTQLAGI